MNIDKQTVDKILKILDEEIVPAEGCTEPIAIAYVAAKAAKLLGKTPERVKIYVSGNIIKNVKSVVVPNSGGMVGIEVSAGMGIIAGKASKGLMVISDISKDDMKKVREFLDSCPIEVIHEHPTITAPSKPPTNHQNYFVKREIGKIHQALFYIGKEWEVVEGDWIIKIKYKDKIYVEKTFKLVK
jgi:L-cysteine desulfidase